MKALYFAVFLLAGCKTLHTLDVKEHQEAASAATTETHEVKSAGPEHIVMTVEEYEQLCPASVHDVKPQRQSDTAGVSLQHAPEENSSDHGPLVRRTVTVTDRGPSLDDLRSLSSLQSKVNTALAVKTLDKRAPALSCALSGWLLGVGLPLALGALLWRLKPSWLGFLWKLLGRSP